jgi:hypothetical protein
MRRHRLAAACLVSAAAVALSRASCRQRAARAVATAAVANLSANQASGAIGAARGSEDGEGPAPAPPPLLSDLVDAAAQRVKSPSGVGFLLDFAIVGYPKTGTSFLLDWLARAGDQVLASTSEVHDLADGRVADFVAGLYRLRPGAASEGNSSSSSGGGASPFPGAGYKRGYKAPRDLQIPGAMSALDLYWPNAALIVGLRHPVLWFESYYNFRVRKGAPMPPADSSLFLDPGCESSGRARGVCADGCRYHAHLSRLGKTPMTSPEELGLLGSDGGGPEAEAGRRPSRRRIFLYEISQLREASGPGAAAVVGGSDNSTRSSLDGGAATAVAARAERFRLDLSRFLGLDRPLADDYSEPSQYLPNRTRALDICEPRYSELRRHLMRNAREASTWIREYLLAPRPSSSASSVAGDVVVSSPPHFRSLLRAWMSDPCLEGR